MNRVYNLLAIRLTPAVRHDLEGQRQKVIEGSVQH